MNRHRCAGLALSLTLAAVAPAYADPWPSIEIPAGNRARQTSPPPRPAVGDLAARAQTLVDALNGDAGANGEPLFLQREPFLAIKDMRGAAGYFATLLRWYARDIEAMRAELPRGAGRWAVARVELSSRCVWMTEGREANRLPYYSCYGSRLVLARNGREHTVRLNVLINWGASWYVTHLGAIPQRH